MDGWRDGWMDIMSAIAYISALFGFLGGPKQYPNETEGGRLVWLGGATGAELRG